MDIESFGGGLVAEIETQKAAINSQSFFLNIFILVFCITAFFAG